MASVPSLLLRDYLESNTGLLGEAVRNARIRREQRQEMLKRVKVIEEKTKEIKVVRSSLAVTYNNFQQIDRDLKILARAMAAHIGLEDEDFGLQKQRDSLRGKKKPLNLLQQTKEDEDELNGVFRFFRLPGRGRPKRKPSSKRKPPRGARPPRRPPRVPPGRRPPRGRVPPGQGRPQRVPSGPRRPTPGRVPPGQRPPLGTGRPPARVPPIVGRVPSEDEIRRTQAATAALEAEQKRITELQERVRTQQAALQQERARFAVETEEFKKQTVQLEQQRATLQKQIAELETKRAGAAMALERVNADTERIRTNVARLQADIANAEQERLKLEQRRTQALVDARNASLDAAKARYAEIRANWENYNRTADELGRPRRSIDSLIAQQELAKPNLEASDRRVNAEFDRKIAEFDSKINSTNAAIAAEREALARQAYVYEHINNNLTRTEVQQNAARNQIAETVQRQAAASEAIRVAPDREAALLARERALADSAKYAEELAKRPPAILPTPPAAVPPAAAAPPVKPPPPTKVVHVPLNGQALAAAQAFAKNAIVQKLGAAIYKKLPVIGIGIVAGIAVWQLAQGKVSQAAISVAEGFDPTFVGVTAATLKYQVKLETYFNLHKIDYHVEKIINPELAEQRWDEVTKIVDAQWAKVQEELANTWKTFKEGLKEQWRRDLDKGLLNVLRESITSQPTEGREVDRLGRRRGRGRNVVPYVAGEGQPAPPTPVDIPTITGRAISVAGAIREASKLIGVDEALMLAMARQESGFVADIVNPDSKATGLFQFLDSTWREITSKNPQYAEIFARGPKDPFANSIAGAILLKNNIQALKSNGLEVNHRNLYAAHFFGATGAAALLRANPNKIAADVIKPLIPKGPEQNLNTFYIGGDKSKPRTVGQLLELLQIKVGNYVPEYSRELQQGGSGEEIVGRTLALRAARQQGQQRPAPVVQPSHTTTYVPVQNGPGASRSENIPMVGR